MKFLFCITAGVGIYGSREGTSDFILFGLQTFWTSDLNFGLSIFTSGQFPVESVGSVTIILQIYNNTLYCHCVTYNGQEVNNLCYIN